MENDVIEIKKPEPDSQYRLLPCKCGGDNVAYVHYNGERAECCRGQSKRGERVAAVEILGADSDQEISGTATGTGGAAWRVKCFDCGHTVDKGNRVRHDAQLNWNGEGSQ